MYRTSHNTFQPYGCFESISQIKVWALDVMEKELVNNTTILRNEERDARSKFTENNEKIISCRNFASYSEKRLNSAIGQRNLTRSCKKDTLNDFDRDIQDIKNELERNKAELVRLEESISGVKDTITSCETRYENVKKLYRIHQENISSSLPFAKYNNACTQSVSDRMKAEEIYRQALVNVEEAKRHERESKQRMEDWLKQSMSSCLNNMSVN
jgi:chromosome segregation ATPase